MAVSHVFSNTVANWTGTVTVGQSNGSTMTIAATDLIRPANWNSVHNQFYTLSGNTNLSSTASGTNVVFSAAGQVTLVGSSDTIVISGQPHVSYFENLAPFASNVTRTLNVSSISDAVLFHLPQPVSASFLRLPVSLSTGSTSVATVNANRNMSAEIYSTWNAVVYSVGTGANSRSLQSVASGSAGFTFQNSVSVAGGAAAGTQYSATQAFTHQVEGASATQTTQYSSSQTRIDFFSTFGVHTNFSGLRFIDIPFANSLSAGPYWLVFGYSSSANTNSTAISAGTVARVFYSNHYGASQADLAFGIMGSTNFVSGGLLGAGSFSTAGGGTTNSIPVSAISSQASNVRPYFQLRRSA